VSAVGSCIPGDTSDIDIIPVKFILLTFWESKEAHERSHKIPEFEEVFNSLPENLAKMPYEEFYEVLK
jgi:heme-degrading monooxygenase HmoA